MIFDVYKTRNQEFRKNEQSLLDFIYLLLSLMPVKYVTFITIPATRRVVLANNKTTT